MPKEKLTDEQFLELLAENSGLYTLTARAIQKKYGIAYSRQAVYERAQKHPDFLREVEEENIDTAHLTFLELMRQKNNLDIRFKTARFYAQTKGKAQFSTKPEEKPPYELKEQIIKIGNGVLRFLIPSRNK